VHRGRKGSNPNTNQSNVLMLMEECLSNPWSTVLVENLIRPFTGHEIFCSLWNLKVHYCVHRGSPLVCTNRRP